jgi:hypothetical protein
LANAIDTDHDHAGRHDAMVPPLVQRAFSALGENAPISVDTSRESIAGSAAADGS